MRIKLAYHSGTGGAERIALCFAHEFAGKEHDVDIERIRRAKDVPVPLTGFDMLMVVSVVHDFNIPHQMMLWLQSLNIPLGLPVAFISVSAGGAAITNRAVRRSAIKLLKTKGADVFFEDMFPMPCNYFFRIKQPVDAMEMEAYPLMARKRFGQIMANERKRLKVPLIDRLITWSCRNAWKRGAAFGQAITVSDACTACGVCVMNCPSGNIKLAPILNEDNVSNLIDSDKNAQIASAECPFTEPEPEPVLRPVFSDKCAICLNCFYVCEQAALHPRREKVAVLKEGFDLEKIASRKATDDEWRSLESFTGGWLYSDIRSYLIEARELRN
ncbi:MAG: hypothetical protein GX562_00515 [Coriobacteriaceae bacterium]|nr:hypothetical protein [Coriobacteriaceae bacterium]